jgi:hypothetical protein
MKISKIIIFTLIFANSLQGFGFDWNTAISCAALFMSNMYHGPSQSQIDKFKSIPQSTTERKSLNEQPAFQQSINEILKTHQVENNNIQIYLDRSNLGNQTIEAWTVDNKIFVTPATATGLHQNGPIEYKNTASIVIGHEIGHTLQKQGAENNFFQKWLFVGSNIALFKVFNNILDSDNHPFVKYSSIATLAGANYYLNSAFKSFSSQQKEKDADFHAIKHTKDPEAIRHYVTYYKNKVAPRCPNNISSTIFGTHHPSHQRITAFENAAKIREAQSKKMPVDTKIRVFGKTLNDID